MQSGVGAHSILDCTFGQVLSHCRMLACDAVRVRNNAWPSVTEQHMAMAHVGHLHQAGLALAPGACPAAFVRAVIVWRVRSPVINMCDVWLQDCQGLHGVRLSITSYVYALITLQILWPHWPLQRDDRALGHVPRSWPCACPARPPPRCSSPAPSGTRYTRTAGGERRAQPGQHAPRHAAGMHCQDWSEQICFWSTTFCLPWLLI